MSTIINGTSNAVTFPDSSVQNTSAIVSGYVPYANLPAGSILQVVTATTNVTLSATNSDVDTYNFQAAITPKFSTSKMLVFVSVNGIDNGSSSGRMSTSLYQSTTGGNTAGTQRMNTQVADNGTSTTGMMSTSFSYLSGAIGSTTTQYFKVINAKNDGSSTWYVQRYNCDSSITVMEIAA